MTNVGGAVLDQNTPRHRSQLGWLCCDLNQPVGGSLSERCGTRNRCASEPHIARRVSAFGQASHDDCATRSWLGCGTKQVRVSTTSKPRRDEWLGHSFGRPAPGLEGVVEGVDVRTREEVNQERYPTTSSCHGPMCTKRELGRAGLPCSIGA